MDQNTLVVILLVLGAAVLALVVYYALRTRRSAGGGRPFHVDTGGATADGLRHEPAHGDPEALTSPEPGEVGGRPYGPARPGASRRDGRLDPNTASSEELAELPGFGEVLANRIVEHRERHGPFRSIDELAEVEGIGEKTADDLKRHLQFPEAA